MIERDEALFEINHEGKVHDIDEIRSQEIGHDHDEEADDDGFQTEDMLNITDETTQGTQDPNLFLTIKDTAGYVVCQEDQGKITNQRYNDRNQ